MRGMKFLFVLGLMISMVFSLCSSVSAQDFGQLLQAVEKMEANLTALIEQESQNRATAIEQLKSGSFNSAGQNGIDSKSFDKFQQELLALRKKVEKLSSSGQATSFTDADFMSVVSDIIELKSENVKLQNYVRESNQKLASIHPGRVPDGDQSATDQLRTEMANLSHDIDKLKTGGKFSKSKTTVNGRLYSHGMVDFSEGTDNQSEFALSRAYITLKSKLSSTAGIRITSDLKQIDDKYNVIIKYAYIDWSPSFSKGITKLRFGLQPTQYIDHMNKLWGRRYLEKTVGDKKKFLTSSDLGFSTIFGFGPKSKYGFVSLALLNGTSYSHVEELNSQKDFNIFSKIKPFKNIPALKKSALMLQFYSGTQNKNVDDIITVDTTVSPAVTTVTEVASSDWKRQIFSAGGLFAWNSTLDAGFDLNYTSIGHGPDKDATKKRGLSFFGSFYLNKLASQTPFLSSLNFFGRVDLYDPQSGIGNNNETMTIVGVESAPVKGFKVALSYRGTSFEDDSKDSNNMFYANTLFKF